MKRVLIAAALLGLLYVPAQAATPRCGIEVLDGDTVRICRTVYRLTGYDAPGVRRKSCWEAGLDAKRRLSQLLAPPAKVTFYTQGKDRYGRTLARFLARGHTGGVHRSKVYRVDKIMRAEGHHTDTRVCE